MIPMACPPMNLIPTRINLTRWRHALALSVCVVAPLLAQGPQVGPQSAGTVKDTVALEADLFPRQLRLIEERRAAWLQKAEQATPKLIRTPKLPVSLAAMQRDAAGFQGWKAVASGQVESICHRPFLPSESFILDFGEHVVGHFSLSLRQFDIPVDAPVRLAFVFGEVPAEVAESFDSYAGTLTRAWLQDEVVNFDVVPAAVQLPRRYAFRYVKITVVSASRHGKFGFAGFAAEAVTSADESRLLPFTPRNADEARIDLVSRRTLRDCMQTVFEDGPKRDRRLWLGDLRLQALANYATYRHYDLVKRSLYLLAGTATKKGVVSTSAYERPSPVGDLTCLDYTALFAPTVLEYLEASGDRATAEDLWPLVLKQLDLTLTPLNSDGLLVPAKGWWLFVDWHPTLDKQAAGHAIVLYGLRATLRLAEKLGKSTEMSTLAPLVSRMEAAARRHLWDESLGLFVSGTERQVSWASQAWMILAHVPTADQGRRALQAVLANPAATKPGTPYLHHYVVEALWQVGLQAEATQLLHAHWGGMIGKGADTFWEVYTPSDDFASPYKSHLMNSYCHAWSCTPTYLLRTTMRPAP